MSISIKEISKRGELRKFIYLPARIHASHKNWVPPIYMNDWRYFNARRNNAFKYSDTTKVLAYRGKNIVGRIMGIINRRYNEFRSEKTARWGYLETWNDEDVIGALLDYVENWAKQKGMQKIVGPYGFTDQDPEGFLVEGFDAPVTIASYYNFEWMPQMVENRGYTKDIDYVVYKLEVPKEIPDFYKRIYERVEKKDEFEIIEFKKRRKLRPWIKPVLGLMNECYTQSNIYGYTPLDEKEMTELAKRYLPFLDPRFVKAVKSGDDVVAFIIGMRSIVEGIRAAKGHLLPFGIFKILRTAKKTKQLDLLLGAIKEQYRGRGLDVLMGVKTLISAHEAGLKVIDTHHEMESNVKVRAEMEKMGGVIYKRFRVYKKDL